jgi:hypothetical protein
MAKAIRETIITLPALNQMAVDVADPIRPQVTEEQWGDLIKRIVAAFLKLRPIDERGEE